jgi:uncharacterized protein (TIGR03435 family)
VKGGYRGNPIPIKIDVNTMDDYTSGRRRGSDTAADLREQLGLRLESKEDPVDFLVVDHAQKVPAEN